MSCSVATFLNKLGYKSYCDDHDKDYKCPISLWHKFKSDLVFSWRMFTHNDWHSYYVGIGAMLALTFLPISYRRYYQSLTPFVVYGVILVFLIEIIRILN